MSAAPALEVDLVNAALLGTDRRAVPAPPGTDPATWLLEAAAGRRATRLVVGATTVARAGDPDGPPARPAPPAARELLEELLRSASGAGLDLWLREALAAGVGLAPEHWAPVLDRARRSTELDRHRLGAALGERGLWFARHNPAWSVVVRAAGLPAPPPPASGPAALAALVADPDRLRTLPDPWPDAVVRTALAVLASGLVPLRSARALGLAVGTHVPLEAYAALTEAADERLAPRRRIGPRPTETERVALAAARTGLAAAEEVLWARWGLGALLDPTRVPPERRPVPLAPALEDLR